MGIVRRCDDRLDFDLELSGELKVSLVVSGYRHDRSGAVADQHIVGNPDGDPFSVDGVDSITAREDAAFPFRKIGPVKIAFHRGLLAIGIHG